MTRERLAGLETEYAIRFTPAHEGAPLPSNALVYTAIMRAVGERVRMIGKKPLEEVLDGAFDGRVFVENGGAFNYEAIPLAMDGGLLEGATPECRSASALVLYQAAQDRLLAEALPRAEVLLGGYGFSGTIGLLKNCRDGFDNVYGAQENYEVDVASGARLAAFRFALALLTPWIVFWLLSFWLSLIVALVVFLCVGLPLLTVVVVVLVLTDRLESKAPWLAALVSDAPKYERAPNPFNRLLHFYVLWVSEAVVLPVGWLAHLFLLVPLRRDTLAFFASRLVLSGAGSVRADGTYHLAEKAIDILRTMRRSARPEARGIFEPAALLKAPGRLLWLDLAGYARAFSKRQRLQIGMSDSNLAQTAELLKVATARIVLDLHDAGALSDAPRLADPIGAVHAITADPTLQVEVRLADGRTLSSLAIQRFYLERAEAHFARSAVVDLETSEVLRLWRQALDALEDEPGSLVGRIDWVTKRFLLERHDDPAARKKVDLKYHELVDGYFRRLEAEGVAPRLTEPDEVHAAMHNPPADTPAFLRSRWIRKLGDETARVEVDWASIRIGGRFRGRVVRLVEDPDD